MTGVGGSALCARSRFDRGLAGRARAPASGRSTVSADLSRLASAARHAQIAARCAPTQPDWAGTLVAHQIPPYVVAFAYIGDRTVWLLAQRVRRCPASRSRAVLVFLHELVHTGGYGRARRKLPALAGERRFLQSSLG